MAQQLICSIYAVNQNSQSIGSNGQLQGFPTQGITIRPATAADVYNGVTCHAIIQLLPTGTQVNQPQYAAASTVSTLVTASNA